MQIVATPHIGKLSLKTVCEQAYSHTIVVDKTDITESRGEFSYKKLLGRLSQTHRSADVHRYMYRKVLFFEEQLKKQLFQSAVDIPVHKS